MTFDGGTHLDGARLDSNLTAVDGASIKDARTVDVSVVETSKPGDGSSGVDVSRDAALDGPRDVAIDVAKMDVAVDVSKADGKTDLAKDGAIDTANQDVAANSCSSPMVVPWDSTSQHTEITVDTTNESHDFDVACGTGGRDLVLMFRLQASNNVVYADTFGASWNTILQFSDVCPPQASTAAPGVVSCNDDACGTSQSQATALLTAGFHYLIISGANDEAGPVTIHLQRAEASINGLQELPAGTSTMQGTNSGASSVSVCPGAGAGPETTYAWITCPDYAGGDLKASTCNGSTLDIVMSLAVPRTDLLTCQSGDICGLQEEITAAVPPGAGLNVLTVDGDTPRDQGDFTMTYSRP